MATAFEKVMSSRKELVDKIIANMQQGYIFQREKWNKSALVPNNPLSGARYRGGNRLRLMMAAIEEERTDPRWMTFKQISDAGYHLKKGSHGVLCEKFIFEKQVENEDGTKETIELDKPIINIFYVFNGEDVEGLPELEQNSLEDWEQMALIDDMIASSECPIIETAQGDAFYSEMKDMICLPLRSVFRDDIVFLATLIHEMSHSTGHPSRLNRDMSGEFGSEKYAREELRAEMGSYFMQSDLGVCLDAEHINDHSNYFVSWIKVLQDDPNELFRAVADADRIAERLMGNYHKLLKERSNEPEHNQAEQPVPTGCAR